MGCGGALFFGGAIELPIVMAVPKFGAVLDSPTAAEPKPSQLSWLQARAHAPATKKAPPTPSSLTNAG